MPTESFSPEKLHPVSNTFKYYFMIINIKLSISINHAKLT